MLTERQIEVVTGLANGLTVKEIAWEMKLSQKTVEYHSAKARRKIGHSSIAMVTRWAVSNGLVPIWPP